MSQPKYSLMDTPYVVFTLCVLNTAVMQSLLGLEGGFLKHRRTHTVK